MPLLEKDTQYSQELELRAPSGSRNRNLSMGGAQTHSLDLATSGFGHSQEILFTNRIGTS